MFADEGDERRFMTDFATTGLSVQRSIRLRLVTCGQVKCRRVTMTSSTLTSISTVAMGGGHTHSQPRSGNATDYPQWNFSPGAKWIKGLTKDRTGNFTGGHFADVNLSSVLFTHRLDDAKHIELQRWSAPGLSKPSFEEALKQDFQPAKKGESIGPSCE